MPDADHSPFLSVIVPSYNEQHNIERGVLKELISYLKQQPYTWELILSDDGSTDGTVESLQQFAKQHPEVTVLTNSHAGKGPAVTAGMLAAHGQWRLYTDFDQSTPIQEVTKLLPYTDQYQVIFGSREIAGAKRDKEPFYRHLMGRGFNLLVRIFLRLDYRDTQIGAKIFKKEAIEKIKDNIKVTSWAFDVNILYNLKKEGFKIVEIGVHHFPAKRVGTGAKLNVIIGSFIDLIKLWWKLK